MGLSLIESVVALFLLGAALLSAGGLLASGARQVAGAGRMSAALSVAHGLVEASAGSSLVRVLERLECDPALERCEVEAPVEAWGVPPAPRLGAARATLRLEALDALSLGGAAAIRVTGIVVWPEGPRERRVRTVTVRG